MNQITTYSTLQAAVAGMVHRATDTNITDNVPLFIQLAEAEFNDILLLKNQEVDEALTTSIGSATVALPTGYISPVSVWLIVDGERVLLNPALPQELPYDTSNTQPKYWAIDGANLRFDCPCDKVYTARMRFIKASNLSVSNTTNYLLLKRPDVYLYGALRQAALFQQDNENLPKWDRMYQQGIKTLKAAENRNRSVVPLRMDMPTTGSSANIYRGE